MHLYGTAVSPFVQRALMVARAKGHDMALDTLPGVSIQSPEFRAISPTGRVPLLELDDGTRLCESQAIAAYLDEVLDGPSLMPVDPVGRARVREIEAVATLEFATGMRPVLVHKVFGRPGGENVVEAALAQATKGADVLDRMLSASTTYAVGDTLTLADCVLVPVFNLALVIDARAGTGCVVRDRSNISRYFDRMAADPVAGRSVTEMNEDFAAMMVRNAPAG